MIQGSVQDSRLILARFLASNLHPPCRLCLNCCVTLGSIKTAQLELLGYTVSDQAFRERPMCYTWRDILICFSLQWRFRRHPMCLPSLVCLALGLTPVQESVLLSTINHKATRCSIAYFNRTFPLRTFLPSSLGARTIPRKSTQATSLSARSSLDWKISRMNPVFQLLRFHHSTLRTSIGKCS